MKYYKTTLCSLFSILIILTSASYLLSQSSRYKEEDLVKIWKTWLKKFPVSKDAIKLEVKQSFPSEDLYEKDVYLWRPIGLNSLLNGNIVVYDQKACHILMFDQQGTYIRKIGKKGQGPGEFSNILCLFATPKNIIVGDTGNMRLQFFDLKGNYVRGFRIFKTFRNIAISNNELIYAVPLRSHPESLLVDILDNTGKLLTSFGEARFGSKSNWLIPNMIIISINDKDELFTAYESFPLVSKYSKKGDLLAEYKLKHIVMREKEKINLNRIKKKRPLMTVIFSIRASTEGFYILQNFPRTEILEYDNNGRLLNDYYYEYENEAYDTFFGDFFVIEKEGQKTFYLLKKVPENKIVILRPKKIQSTKERR